MIEQQSEDVINDKIIDAEIIEDVGYEIPEYLRSDSQNKSKNGLKLVWGLLICAAIYGSWWVANLPDAKQKSEMRAAQFEEAKQLVQQKVVERAEQREELQQVAPLITAIEPPKMPTKLPEKLPSESQENIDEVAQLQITKLQAELQELRQANAALQQEHSRQMEVLESKVELAEKIAQNQPLTELLQQSINNYYAENPQNNVLGSLVKIRKIGAEHAGDDDAAIIAKLEYAAQHNQLKDAVELAQKLSVEASPYFKKWRKIAYATLEMQQSNKEIGE